MSRLPATRDGQASRVPATPVGDVSTVEFLELLVGSHQCVDLTLDDIEVDAVDGHEAAELLGQPTRAQSHRPGGCGASLVDHV